MNLLNWIENNKIWIKDPTKGRILFNLYEYQKHLIEDFDLYRGNIVFHARQLGITQTLALYTLAYAVCNFDKNILIVTTNRETAKRFIKKIVYMYERLTRLSLDNEMCSYAKSSIEFFNGTKIYAINGVEETGCEEAPDLVIMDGAGWFHNFATTFAALYPTISENGKCIIASTGYSPANHSLHKLWNDDKSRFHKTLLNWSVHPERDERWFRNIEKMCSKEYLQQEFTLENI
jgi:hypothetical protein